MARAPYRLTAARAAHVQKSGERTIADGRNSAPKTEGFKIVRKTLADGTRKEYRYPNSNRKVVTEQAAERASRWSGEDPILTPSEAASYLRVVTTGTLRNYRARKRGPPFLKIGRRPMYPLSLLQRWRNERLQLCDLRDNENEKNNT